MTRAARSVAEAPRTGRYARGERRREELLDAVLALIADEGVAAVTHRAVAARAGVSHRLTTYYFQSKEQMLLEAFRRLAARSLERAEAAARALGDAGDREAAMEAAIDAVSEAVAGELRAEEADAAAELSLVLEIARAREPSLVSDYVAWQERVERILRDHAERLGSDDPRADARIIAAVMRGLQTEALGRPDRPLRRREVRTLLARLLHRL